MLHQDQVLAHPLLYLQAVIFRISPSTGRVGKWEEVLAVQLGNGHAARNLGWNV